MAEETKKSTTTKKRTTSKPQVEEPKSTSIEEQMAQMMAMMMAQQQQIMELMKNQQGETKTAQVEVVEEVEAKEQKKLTKQELRRKYKGEDIYVMNATQGAISFKGRNMRYSWDSYGDIEPMTIDDIVNMPKKFLSAPYLLIDKHENKNNIKGDVKKDIEETLGIEDVDGYIALLEDIETEGFDYVNNEDETIVSRMKEVIKKARKRGCDITLDLAILVQHKIDRKELTNMHTISELQKLLGRKFL